jgi:hypothetical protein
METVTAHSRRAVRKELVPGQPTPTNKQTMNGKSKARRPEYAIKETPKNKTRDLRLDIAEGNVETVLQRAFALAKKTGQELNLTIVMGAS